jgi:hypothetical protein
VVLEVLESAVGADFSAGLVVEELPIKSNKNIVTFAFLLKEIIGFT